MVPLMDCVVGTTWPRTFLSLRPFALAMCFYGAFLPEAGDTSLPLGFGLWGGSKHDISRGMKSPLLFLEVLKTAM